MALLHIEQSTGLDEEDALRQELENFRILVDVTNTVIAKRDLNELSCELSDEIHHFFNISYISLDLPDNTNQRLSRYTTYFKSNQKVQRTQENLSLNSPTLSRVFNEPQARLIYGCKFNRHNNNDEYIGSMLKTTLPVFCLLPLIFNEKVLGVLCLGSIDDSVFSSKNIHLLQHIAARISIAIDNALAYEEISRLKDNLLYENQYLTEEIKNFENFDEIIGQSEAMSSVLEQVAMVAESDCTVLILGETGTGKELIARAIHKMSQRSARTMIKVNCAAIPSGLLESDLFGHEKGAFTGATAQRIGRFEQANRSSLFLDEVGDIPLELQSKLLRVIQEREIERLGSNKIIPVDVRLIAATNCNLHQMVIDKQYRSDLYYRLNVFPIVIPPLRDRPEDIPLLVKFFTKKIARRMNRHIESVPTETINLLKKLPWPGNVRELENVIERAVILTKGTMLNLQPHELQHHLSPMDSHPQPVKVMAKLMKTKPVKLADDDETERQEIIRVLKETNGIVAGPRGAAEKLGLKRTTLLSRMQRLGISVKDIQDDN
ncbi:sigma 54-interacting transcriptional regulator [Budviciaceae bacterium BWR-B9]|uniref:Sigma 54-interacting transcriptional regulator n=1 Tax=Limnobaculum allomyrinae TaxID=2791986 RepID=A0ABS1IVM3_9GAMM|nr:MULTISPECIES: sigma 54-interacting transcriptional regulator [Limnobaculum]MBK5145798.1 sigma 54-interacting transcriptional regulator [Limnobaculum allomyrinae]MBV7693897.1 sigma 54-interacting transcriptional regulator [Limnobaculum sp. M2-1]